MSYLVAKETISLLKSETVTDFWLFYQELSHGNVCMSLSLSLSLKKEKQVLRRDHAGEISIDL